MRSKTGSFFTSFMLFFMGFILSTSLAFGAPCPDPANPAATQTVPNVLGQTQSTAAAAIGAAGLTVGTISSSGSNPVVISQFPVADVCALPGDPVNLTLAALVPDVVGLNRAAAIQTIQAAGLTATVTTASDPTVPMGVVISQDPIGGLIIPPGVTTIAIVVSTGSGLDATVPNVVGLAQTAAITAIQGANLKPTITTEESATVPAGTVIRQDPVGGLNVASGSEVAIVVSSGSGLDATVPNVVGLAQTAAIAAIQGANLTATVTTEESTTVPAGTVIQQDPVGGIKVASGSAVAIVVSAGFTAITVPNVIGQSVADAQTAITGVNLTVGTMTLAASDTAPAGTVISQNPGGGSQVAPNTSINLTVSSGTAAPTPPPITPGDIPVPSVIGLAKTTAASIIRNTGLVVGAIIQKYDETIPAGTVIDQSPAAGTLVGAGVAVSLTVSLGPAGAVTLPDVKGLSEEAAKSILLNAGLTIGNVQRQPDPTTAPGLAIGTNPAAGEQVKIGSAVNLIVSDGLSQPQQCTVPDVVNQTVENAREILFATCLSKVGAITVETSTAIPAGLVAAQTPAAGSQIGYNTTVNLVVSAGSQPPVATPKVVGMTLADATIVLNSFGLTVGKVTRQTSNTVEEGHIISQNPLMTALAPKGWPVNLVVSLGPVPDDPNARPQTQVPNLEGMTLASATVTLLEAGLRIGLVANARSADVTAGHIIRQSAAPDTTLPINSRVNLTVSFGPYAYGLLSGPAYITNYAGGTVSILDPATEKLVDNLPVSIGNSAGPSGVAVHPDGTKLYVVNRPQYGRSAGSVTVIDLIDRKVAGIIPVGIAPLGIAINPTGEQVFVANEGSFSLSIINTDTNQPAIDLSGSGLAANSYPRGVAVHPNPLRPLVYVTNRTVNSFSDDATNTNIDQCDALVARPPVNVNPDQCVGSLSIFDADLKRQVGSVAVGWAPEGVAVHPDGLLAYVANSGDRTVSVVDTVLNRVVGVIALDGFGGAPPPLAPRGIAVNPDGNRLYVTDGAGNRLFVIDITANHAIVDIVPVGKKPYGVAVSADGKRIYVANTDDNSVSIVDGRNNKVITTVPVGLGPWGFGQFVGPLVSVEKPTFDPPSGPISNGATITISTNTPGASIRYTIDGSTPTSTTGIPVENGQSIVLTLPKGQRGGDITLQAIAYKDTWADSDVAVATYSINRFFGRNNLP